MISFKPATNDVSLAGRPAARKQFFGENSRYAIAPVHTRTGEIQWFVWDAEKLDEVTGTPAVIRQENTLEDSMRGLAA